MIHQGVSIEPPFFFKHTTTMTIKIHPLDPMPLLGDPPPWNEKPARAAESLGQTLLGNSIALHNPGKANLLVMGGAHGDESEGIFLAHLLVSAQETVPVIPCINPDGALLRQRWNRNNVDLNRNLPSPDWKPEPLNPRYPPGSKPASEPETQAFLKTLERVGCSTVLSLHSYKETFIEIERPPETMSDTLNGAVDQYVRAAGIERRLSIGYPTPGALGAYGLDNGLLILTYELRRGMSHGEIYELLPHFLKLTEALNAERFAPKG